MGAVIITHWILDLATHRPDLPLWPGGPEVGLGLWNSIPATLIIEGSLLIAAVVVFVRAFAPRHQLWEVVLLDAGGPGRPHLGKPTMVSTAANIKCSCGCRSHSVVVAAMGRWIERHRQALTSHTPQ